MLIQHYAFRFETVPGNSAFVVPFDSTRGPALQSWVSIASASALLAPGAWRGKFTPFVVKYSVACTGQNVTVDEQALVGNAGTSADWVTQGAIGTFTVTAAAAATLREFTPGVPDARLLVTAGATGPTTLTIWGVVYGTMDRGS